jgi:hypothetical protein
LIPSRGRDFFFATKLKQASYEISSGDKMQPEYEGDHSFASSVEIYTHSPIGLHGVVLRHRGNFIFIYDMYYHYCSFGKAILKAVKQFHFGS